MKNKIICWWSGGVTSAVACKLAINIYGAENCGVIMIDTKNEHPDKFNVMADLEHELTEMKGEPVTMLKDQSNDAKEKMKVNAKSHLVFLKFNPNYPNNKCLDDMPLRSVEPLFDCNGMCGTNDLSERSQTELELNFE